MILRKTKFLAALTLLSLCTLTQHLHRLDATQVPDGSRPKAASPFLSWLSQTITSLRSVVPFRLKESTQARSKAPKWISNRSDNRRASATKHIFCRISSKTVNSSAFQTKVWAMFPAIGRSTSWGISLTWRRRNSMMTRVKRRQISFRIASSRKWYTRLICRSMESAVRTLAMWTLWTTMSRSIHQKVSTQMTFICRTLRRASSHNQWYRVPILIATWWKTAGSPYR